MIELKNVEKTYKSKKSANTKALDGVSLNLGEKGVTFILGKSGSGKSTLLNLLGGLDKYDKGDIVIYGKSSKEFKQADFDSYRNTYVGFIFQEFNILEDYDVYQNIVLALQLQQKEINEKEIDELLDRLELKHLKKRRVNELSGGQKQRVAIARALVKDPKIILADEPTGNLDSKTGKDVMELLKEISKEKLVVIVSHDEEYAKKYGDRIIEISDGKIVKDTKELKAKEEENNYKIIKSKLPIKESFKLGLGSLKHKKIKLFFTILLTIITLGFLSCADTLSNYKYEKEHVKVLKDKGEQFVEIQKTDTLNFYGYKEKLTLSLDEEAEKEINEKVKKDGYGVYKYIQSGSFDDLFHIQFINNNSYGYDYFEPEIVKGDPSFLKEELIGSKPEGNGIVISNYVADKIIKNGIEVWEKTENSEFKTSNIFRPETYEDILNTKYTYYFGEEGKIKIVGIIKYDYKGKGREYKENVINKVYVAEDFESHVKLPKVNRLKEYLASRVTIKDMNAAEYIETAALDGNVKYYDGSKWRTVSSIGKDEVIISLRSILVDNSYDEDLMNYINKKLEQNWNVDTEVLRRKFFENYVKTLGVIGKEVSLKLYYSQYGDNAKAKEEVNNLKVIGVHNDDNNYYSNYFSKDLIGKYAANPLEKVSILYPTTDKKEFSRLSKIFPLDGDLYLKTTYSDTLISEKGSFSTLKKLASYMSLVFLAFTIILISNFMFTSISYRKKEIGILRALGSRNADVAKIFLWEAITLSVISGTIASILLVIVTNLMNTYIMGLIHVITTPFVVGIRQFLVIYILVFAITVLSSLMPILRISRKKPIDAILNK